MPPLPPTTPRRMRPSTDNLTLSGVREGLARKRVVAGAGGHVASLGARRAPAALLAPAPPP
eukprot:5022011-Prymnesium_polylepis.1